MTCKDVSDVSDLDIDDFYRYYFAWFEVFRMIRDGNWEMAEQLSQSVHGFIPALFKKQEKFWKLKTRPLLTNMETHFNECLRFLSQPSACQS